MWLFLICIILVHWMFAKPFARFVSAPFACRKCFHVHAGSKAYVEIRLEKKIRYSRFQIENASKRWYLVLGIWRRGHLVW